MEEQPITLLRAASLGDFVAHPLGRYTVGESHLAWCHSATLCGWIHWGRPTEHDTRNFTAALEWVRHPALSRDVDVLTDEAALESVDWNGFGVFVDYMRTMRSAWSRVLRRQAVIVPPGPIGFLLAGLAPLVGVSHQVRFFSQPDETIQWLGRAELTAVHAHVGSLCDQVRGISPTVQRLRRYLEGSLAGATVEGAAHALRLSPRSLQRELRRVRTHFSQELGRARIRVASHLLEHTDDKIDSIARSVGSASASHLSMLFRRHLGETPARYRARLRMPYCRDQPSISAKRLAARVAPSVSTSR